MPGYTHDPELEESTNRLMMWGGFLMLALVLAFPLYRFVEPVNREEARITNLASLADQGREIYALSCASCHGVDGQGVDAPALNSKQFLSAATDDQIQLLVSVGIPGSEMSAYGLDFGGPMTSEQIKAVVTYLRSLEPDAPDRPDWRDMIGAEGGHDDGGGHDEEPTEDDGHDEEPTEDDGHDEEPTEDEADEEPTEDEADEEAAEDEPDEEAAEEEHDETGDDGHHDDD